MESVYKTQCKTFTVARKLAGNFSDVSSFDGAFKPPFCLRIVRAYRTKDVQEFRNKVSQAVREARATVEQE
jgi:hypothetical protein